VGQIDDQGLIHHILARQILVSHARDASSHPQVAMARPWPTCYANVKSDDPFNQKKA
jgi:hypothetical protein